MIDMDDIMSLLFRSLILLGAIAVLSFLYQGYLDDLKLQNQYNREDQIVNLAQARVMKLLRSVDAINTEVNESLILPGLEHGYELTISCESDEIHYKVANVFTDRTTKQVDYINCSAINFDGAVGSGNNCLIGKYVNETNLNITLEDSCGAR